jgi:hypothetical protein
LAVAAGCGTAPLSPEAAREKGDAMLKQMSQKLASSQSFSYKTEQAIERVKADGSKSTDQFTRNTIVQRPNLLAFTETGQAHDGAAWYDGKQVTLVSNRDKIWVRGPMPGTLDEAMDYISAEYAVQIPTADLLYSNPYDALMAPGTTGGWVNLEQVGSRSCEHLSYQHSVVDWQIWLSQDEARLPCQLQVTYKTEPNQPVTRIVFSEWNEKPAISDTTFKPEVPEGYQRIKIMRHATIIDESAEETAKEGGAK